jgi:hypothetical protein
MVMRLRRASGVQRPQLKWLAYAAVLLAGYYVLAFLYTRGSIRSIPALVDTVVSPLGLVWSRRPSAWRCCGTGCTTLTG